VIALIRCVVVCATLQACGAQAHAFLDHARPAVGSTVHGPPTEIRLWFTAPIEPAFTTIRVLDKTGKQVDNKDRHVDQTDPTLIRVTVPALPDGSYRVFWHALSKDTHVTEGDFSFEVAP
jgi:copper resistance protein C